MTKQVAMIDRTKTMRTPSGRKVEVNRFDYNLMMAAIQGENIGIFASRPVSRYIQCTDSSWIRAELLRK